MKSSMVILSGDADAAGTSSMAKLWRELSERTFLLAWPGGMKDANQTFIEHCGRNIDKLRTLVEELTAKAKSTPMPDIYSIQEVMRTGEDTSLVDRQDRLRFPWKSVDEMAILLPGSVLGVMSTSTGQGKTCYSLQFSLFGARKYNETVVNWQCELSPSEIATMVAAQVLHKNRNFLKKEDLKEAADELDGVSYYVGNNPTINNVMDVLDLMEAAVRRCGATVCVLDNLHFYTTGIDDEVRVQAAAMKRIKQMAVQYGLKFIVVSQPRKANAQSRGKKTVIADAKGSASLGDTCDSFMAIHRELSKDTTGEGVDDPYEEKTLVEMLKTRSKGLGKSSAFLQFFGEFAEFSAIEHNYEEAPE
jgi:replicative DNA helicase